MAFVIAAPLAHRTAQQASLEWRRPPCASQSPASSREAASRSPTTTLGPLHGVSRVALGTWAWGNRLLYDYSPSQDLELAEAFAAATARGTTLFDTADSYGTGRFNGRAETLLGQFLRAAPPHTQRRVQIATKYASYPWRLTRNSIVRAAAASAERLGRPADLGQMHWSASRYAPWQERALWDGLADAREQGFCREIGVSNVGPRQLQLIERYLRERRGVKLAAVQVQTSLLMRDAFAGDGLVSTARALDVGVIGYSPLCLGLLCGKYDEQNAPSGPRGALFGALGAERVVRALRAIAAEKGVSAAQVAVAWVAAKDVVVLAGARTAPQAVENADAATIELSVREAELLERVASDGPQMIRNAFETR